MNRREFLATAASAAAVTPAWARQIEGTGPAKRPNILWIVADDHAPYVCGTYGNARVRTPRLDRLATQGLRFDQAYCCSPVCTASRQCFITGRYPRSVGVTQLATALPESEPTLAHYLGEAGYETAAFGKMHFNSRLTHGFAHRLDLEEFHALRKRLGKKPLPAGVRVQPPWRPFKDPASVWLNSACLPFDYTEEDTSAAYFAGEAERFMRQPRDKPFFLVVSFYEPHSPYNFPVEYRGRHSPGEFVAPRPGPEDADQIPLVFKDLTDAQKCGSTAAYYTSAEFLDHSIGRVLDALDRRGHADDTIVVYLADHGYLLGQHGRFEKHCGFDPAIRVPLIVRVPGITRAGSHTTSLVQTIDLVPTMLDLCGIQIPQRVQGRSLLPVLRDNSAGHRDQLFIEYSENAEGYIRTDRWKFIYCAGDRVRRDGYVTANPTPGRTIHLFDLAADPDEMTNLAHRPEHAERVRTFTEQLADHMKRTAREPDRVPKTQDVHQVLDFCLQPRDVSLEALKTNPPHR
ncbi:MAG TPA: sulfatase [Tepidisphaeraceae bacterium]|nr:sulfatase [Tepidisphaeraceae bacterium]